MFKKTTHKVLLFLDLNKIIDYNNDTVLLIGPEGGFSNEEINMFERLNMAFVKLGNYTLRAETAMIASIFAIQNLLYPNK